MHDTNLSVSFWGGVKRRRQNPTKQILDALILRLPE